MPGSDKNCFLSDRRALDLVVSFLDDIKIPPDILNPPFHHSAEWTVIYESGYGTIAF
jgi:hypothetical protein